LGDASKSDGNSNLRAGAAPGPGGEEEKLPVAGAARIVEEVSLEKIGKEHVETSSDEIGRQRAKADRRRPDGKPIPNPQQRPKASQ